MSDIPTLPGLDIAGAVSRLGLEYDDLREMLAGLPPSLNEYFAAAEAAVKGGDAAGTRAAAHSLSGLSGNFGLPAVREAAHALELAAKEGRADELPALLDALRAPLATACDSLGKLI